MRCQGMVRTAVVAGILVACAAVSAGILVVCLAVTNVLAQNPQSAEAQPFKVLLPGEVHPGNSRIYVHVFKAGSFGHEHAVVGRVKEGVIHLGATHDAGHVDADLTSFVADVDYARKLLGLPGETDADTQKKVNANMLGEEVLNVLRFPTARGDITSARLLQQPSANGLPQYLLEGELTLHGVTKKMSVVAEALEQNGWVRLRGHVSLTQSDFGMQPYTTMLGMIGVADQLELYGEAYTSRRATSRRASPRPGSLSSKKFS